jgi:2-iminobutanoate/2-iminopropanoate deaminase
MYRDNSRRFAAKLIFGLLMPVFLFACNSKNNKTMTRQVIYTKKAPEPIGPYSQGIKAGNTIYLSGQIAIDPATGEMSHSDVVQQTKQVMENIAALLEASGAAWENVAKTTIFLHDMNDFPKVNQVYGSYFKEGFPARETVQVSRLPKDALVEISVVAVL